MHDLAIIVVSTNEAHYLEPCLSTVFAHAGDADLDVIVVDNSSTDNTRELVETRFPKARIVPSENHGFAHANNRGAMAADARWILFLNPDTEMVSGSFGELLAELDARPEVGLAGVRQLTPEGELWPTIRRFPSAARALADALGSESWPLRPHWMGERDLDMSRYEDETLCDWVSGSFMLARREALLSAGLLDERFFLNSEEPDLCLRLERSGWKVLYTPKMTIIHHFAKAGVRPKMVAQDAYTRLQYAKKHFSGARRAAYMSAVFTGHAIRALKPSLRRSDAAAARREGARWAMRTILGRRPPYTDPPGTAIIAD